MSPYDDSKGSGSGGPVSLQKVTLTKAAPSVSLTKADAPGGVLRVNLNWNSRSSGGFWKKLAGSGAVDLDLGCLFEYADGSKGVVQALGGTPRDQHSYGPQPICWIDGDDRSGANSAGENLFVDLSRVQHVKRMLVFAFIYEGVPNWAAADGVVTLFPASGPQVEVRLDEARDGASMCAIALLTNDGRDLTVRREVSYLGGHQALDDAYAWGLTWTPARK